MDINTLIEKFDKLLAQKAEAEGLVQAFEAATAEVVAEITKALGKSTFEHKGKYYQGRKRGNRTYLCVLDSPPKGRPKGSGKKQRAAAAAAAASTATATEEPGEVSAADLFT